MKEKVAFTDKSKELKESFQYLILFQWLTLMETVLVTCLWQ